MQTGHAVQLTFGSSGNFFSQIENGAPFDLFFSADVEYPKRLESEGLAQPGTLSRYATGEIVLWTRKESAIPLEGLRALLKPGIRKIAIANPQLAPYGRAAVAALQHEGIYDQVRDKLVIGENISQAAQFVESGNADIGILALSLALAPPLRDKGVYYEIPALFYPAIEQGAVILKSSKQTELAEQFLAFLKKPEIVRLMKSYGLTVPEAGELWRSAKP
jgi:molybdate transport system substrate-binding protein